MQASSFAGSADDGIPAKVVHGTLHVIIEDELANGQSRTRYFLEELGSGQEYELEWEKLPDADLRTGMVATARGWAQGGVLRVAPDGVEYALAAPETIGVRRALVLIADFQDSPVTCANDSVASMMFTGTQNMDALYQETSFGLVSFPGDTDNNGQPDVLRVSISALASGACDPSGWATAAEAAAQTAGVTAHIDPASCRKWK